MKIRKIILMVLMIVLVAGCTKLEDMSYDDIINNVIASNNNCNVFRKGYKLFIPKGLDINEAGPNYAIISSKNIDYYLFVDLINYNSKKEIDYIFSSNSIYSKYLNYNNKKGYVDIKKDANDQYLIEIMYNYAKIEVMVDSNEIKSTLANAISVLKSIVYDDGIIDALLKNDDLIYTEENYNMFNKTKKQSSILDYTEEYHEVDEESPIKDMDLVN